MTKLHLTLRSILLAALLIALPPTQAAPAKTAPAKTAPAKAAPAKKATAPAKPAAKPVDKKTAAAKPADKKAATAKPADKKTAAANKTAAAKPADKKTAANNKTAAKPADKKTAANNKTAAKPADKKTAANNKTTTAKPADKKTTDKNKTTAAAKPADKKNNNCGDQRLAALSAAREGRLDALKKYREQKCPLNITDTSGLTPYDLATLSGHKNVADWLVQNKHAQKDQHSSAYTKTLQTGLNFLGYNAGTANGKQNAATTNAIKAYQKANGLAVNGKTDASWLPGFNTQVNKKLQQKLRAQGYDTGGSKGIIGAKSKNAIQEYRQKHKLGSNDNPLDSQLLAQLMGGEKTNKTKETAAAKRPPATIAAPENDNSRDAEQRATEAIEQQQAEAIARRRDSEREQPAVPLAPPPVAIDREAANRATANLQRAAEAERQAVLTRQENQRRAEAQRQAALAQQEARRRAATASQMNNEFEQQTAERQSAARLAAEQSARQQAEAARARLANESAAREQAEAERARFRAEATQRAQQIAQAQTPAAVQSSGSNVALRPAVSAPVAAQPAPRLALNDNSPRLITPAAAPTTIPAPAAAAPKSRAKPGFNRISGSLSMNGNGSFVSNCTINGQSIDPGWCQQYYPDGDGKQCNAVFSGNGSVVSLTCK